MGEEGEEEEGEVRGKEKGRMKATQGETKQQQQSHHRTPSHLVQLCLLSPLFHGFPLSFDIFLQAIEDHHIPTSEHLPTLGT